MNKLNRGNIIKIKMGGRAWNQDGSFDPSPELVGKEAVIEYSYGQKYGNGDNTGDYSIIFLETGSSQAWFDEEQLEFISDGGEHIIKECKQKHNEYVERVTDLKWIKENYDAENISSGTILQLFKEIEYDSSFNRNGEFFILFDDWNALQPVFTYVFSSNEEDAVSYIRSIFKAEYKDTYEDNVRKFYKKVQEL